MGGECWRAEALTFQHAGEDTDGAECPLPCSRLLKAICTWSLGGQHLGPTWLLRRRGLGATRRYASAWSCWARGGHPGSDGKVTGGRGGLDGTLEAGLREASPSLSPITAPVPSANRHHLQFSLPCHPASLAVTLVCGQESTYITQTLCAQVL